jgi:hypothetical protein
MNNNILQNYKYKNWCKISRYEKLNEDIIYSLEKKVFFNWYFIFKYQKINFSKKFITDFINKMNHYTLYDMDEKNYYTNDLIHDYGLNSFDLKIAKDLIKKLKNIILIKYTISKLGDIGVLISNFV